MTVCFSLYQRYICLINVNCEWKDSYLRVLAAIPWLLLRTCLNSASPSCLESWVDHFLTFQNHRLLSLINSHFRYRPLRTHLWTIPLLPISRSNPLTDWKKIKGRLKEDWKKIEGRMKEDWRKIERSLKEE